MKNKVLEEELKQIQNKATLNLDSDISGESEFIVQPDSNMRWSRSLTVPNTSAKLILNILIQKKKIAQGPKVASK